MRAIAMRVVQFVVVLWLVATFTFALIRIIPGDPIDILLPTQKSNLQAKAKVKEVKEDLGLDKSIFTQYVNYLGDVVTGDLGKDYGSGRPVTDILKKALPVSLQLMLYAQILALAIAIPLGVFTAYRAGTRADRALNATAFGFLAMPNFVLGLLLSFIIGAELKWLPSVGYTPGWLDPIFDSSRTGNFGDHIQSMILPSLTLAVGQIAVYMRLLRSDMIATLQENFITMARSKGLSDRRILWRHALRPSSITLLTVAGLNVGTLIGGAVVVEVIFNMGGMGKAIVIELNEKQYVALQSLILVMAALFVLVNFLVDVLYAIVDPRIRHARAAH
ncbi:MAG: ABC transporter permease [Actinobacteria bacterium]|nr:ABC transporter permease [Actinomycetota bacterium]